jgi:hypothetical protein
MKRYRLGVDEEPLTRSDAVRIALWTLLVAAVWTLIVLFA